jgi:hypothetical protein
MLSIDPWKRPGMQRVLRGRDLGLFHLMIVKLKVVTDVNPRSESKRQRCRKVDGRKQTVSDFEQEAQTEKETEGEKVEEME